MIYSVWHLLHYVPNSRTSGTSYSCKCSSFTWATFKGFSALFVDMASELTLGHVTLGMSSFRDRDSNPSSSADQPVSVFGHPDVRCRSLSRITGSTRWTSGCSSGLRRATTCGGTPSPQSSSRTTRNSPSPSVWKTDPSDTVSVCYSFMRSVL